MVVEQGMMVGCVTAAGATIALAINAHIYAGMVSGCVQCTHWGASLLVQTHQCDVCLLRCLREERDQE